jgi:multiple sugar transport system permease protein
VKTAAARESVGWAAIVIAALFLLPLWIMASGSLRPLGLPPPVSVELLPPLFAFDNYAEAFRVVPLGRYTANSLLVAAVAVPMGVVVASWAGFAAARLPRRQGMLVLIVAGAAALTPLASLLVGRVAIWRVLGLAGTPVPLMAAGLVGVTPLGVLAFAWAFHRLPRDLFDLAREVGLSPLRTWATVAMPLSWPVTAAVAALAFVTSWGSLVEPLVVLADERWFTLPLGLRSLAALDAPFRPLMLAGAVVATAPVVVAFAVLQRGLLRELGGSRSA